MLFVAYGKDNLSCLRKCENAAQAYDLTKDSMLFAKYVMVIEDGKVMYEFSAKRGDKRVTKKSDFNFGAIRPVAKREVKLVKYAEAHTLHNCKAEYFTEMWKQAKE